MLLELTVQDFAIIDRLTVRWGRGLNVITGETGAGKSILVDALGVLLGGRFGTEHIRTGSSRAVVEGVFALDGWVGDRDAAHHFQSLQSVLEQAGVPRADGTLIVTREVSRDTGRSVSRVNGRAVPAPLLQEVGQYLVDIHGQSQHLSLLKPKEHLAFLDRYAGQSEQVESFGAKVRELRSVRQELRRLREEQRRTLREIEVLRHEVREIEAAKLSEEEEEELLKLRARLRNVEKLRGLALQTLQFLAGSDEAPGADLLLGRATRYCTELARLDHELRPYAESLDQALALVSEVVRDLQGYLDGFEEEPRSLEQVEERLLVIADLKRKYGNSVREVLDYLEDARKRLDRIEHYDELVAELESREEALRQETALLALELSEQRQQAARRLEAEVERELEALGIRGCIFRVQMLSEYDPDGLRLSDGETERSLAFDQTGVDRVEFLVSPNPGEAPKPLSRIASGGELARVALALKAILSSVDPRPVLVFDEVDVGVGGRSAGVIGQKLWLLTLQHQVLCVTHLPQVASYADVHLVVRKVVEEGRTRTIIAEVTEEGRVMELAAMLSGPNPSVAAQANAIELLRQSEEWKEALLRVR